MNSFPKILVNIKPNRKKVMKMIIGHILMKEYIYRIVVKMKRFHTNTNFFWYIIDAGAINKTEILISILNE